MNSYVLLVASVVFISVCWAIAWLRLVTAMLYKQAGIKLYVAYCIIFTFIQGIVNIFSQLGYSIGYFEEFLIFSVQALVLTLFVYWKKRDNLLKIASAVMLSYFFIYNFFYVTEQIITLLSSNTLEESTVTAQIARNWFMHFAALLFSIFMGNLIRRVSFRKFFVNLFTTRRKRWLTFAVCLLLMHAYRIVWVLVPDVQNSLHYPFVGGLAILLIFALLLYVAMFETNKSRLATQETLLLQQKSYVQSLETIQKEVRAFRHDYQNMLSGLYLQAEAGDVDSIQDFLKNSTQYFDQNLGNEIKQTAQLSNVHLLEVKSLLMVKLMQIQQLGVTSELEVLQPVDELGMDVEDFLRCLGILLDNAMEAANEATEKLVILVLLSEGATLSVLVKNTLNSQPLLHRICENGYSTKGEHRGVGLASYQRILRQYNNVVSRTRLDDGMFIQQLNIQRR